MWEIIEKNKKKSKLIAFLMVIVFISTGIFYGIFIAAVIVLFLLLASENPEIISIEQYITFSIVCSILSTCVITFLWFLKISTKEDGILENLGAIKTSGRFKYLDDILGEMAVASGIGKAPSLYVVESSIPNAFAIGYEPKKSSIVLTSSLVELLDRNELQGVIAHEIAHIKNFDSKLMTNAYIMLYFIFLLSGRLLNNESSAPRIRRINIRGGRGAGPLLLIVAIVLIVSAIYIFIIAPIFTRILYSMLSKKREYLADACAVQYTRYPSGLANALAKLENTQKNGHFPYDPSEVFSDEEEEEEEDKSMELFNALAIVPNFSNKIKTHPPTKLRIEILNKMAGSSMADYNKQYRRITGQNIVKEHQAFKSQEIIQQVNRPDNLAVVAAAGVVVGGAIATDGEMSRLEKHRAIGEVFEQTANYIKIQCDCETKLKIPQEYIGQKLNCPHCNKEYEIKGEVK